MGGRGSECGRVGGWVVGWAVQGLKLSVVVARAGAVTVAGVVVVVVVAAGVVVVSLLLVGDWRCGCWCCCGWCLMVLLSLVALVQGLLLL